MSALVKALKETLYSVGIKEPWKVMGPWALPDSLHFLPSGHDYRKIAPGSHTIKPVVPHDSPKLIFDTKYYVRDYRRNNTYTARKVDTSPMDFEKVFASAPLKPEQVVEVIRPKSDPTRGF